MPFRDGSLREAIAEALKSRNAELKVSSPTLCTTIMELLVFGKELAAKKPNIELCG
jgi:hypothetical protein